MNSLSDTQICSKALVLIGQNPIADISDTSVPNAVKCNAAYISERDALLREFDWNFARKRAQLQQGPTPDFGWQYAFRVPNDFLAVRLVNDDRWPWALEGQFILTNNSACNLVYTAQIDETGFFDSLFVDCLVYRIARALAYSILKKESVAQEMNALYEKAKPTAKRVDASEQSARHRQQGGSWLEGRDGYRDGWGR